MRTIFVVLACLVICASAHAQSVAQINGTVKDSTGAVLPGVDVKVTQTDTGVSRAAVTNEFGSYTLPSLPVGPYKLEVALPGFKTYVQTGIVLQVNSNPTIPVVLEVGTVDQSVTVEASAAMVETTSNAIGQVIDQQRVVDLPLNGRRITDLATLTGGATDLHNVMLANGNTQGTALTPNRNYPGGGAIAIAGAAGNKTNYRLDGTANMDLVTGASLPFPFPDALQEFKLETSSLPASAGQLPGGMVNVVTKSGTNTFHGGAFEFIRNSAVNARNFFAATNDGVKRNQFGGYLGGPIVRDKAFFFAGYQGTRESVAPAAFVANVATAATKAGDFTAMMGPSCFNRNLGAPYVNNKLDPSRISPIALKILAMIPESTDPCGKLTYSIPSHDREDQAVGKVDYQINEKQSLFVRYFIAKHTVPAAFDGKNLLLMSQQISVGKDDMVQTGSIGHTYTFNTTMLNKIHLGFQRSAIERSPTTGVPTWQELGAGVYSPVKGYFNLSITNYFTPLHGNNNPAPWAATTFMLSDDFSMIRGRHQLGFGFSAWNLRTVAHGHIRTSGSFAFGSTLTGNGLANFIAGLSTSYTQNGGQYMDYHYTGPSLYLQDNFRLNSRLTINAGLRWDPFRAMSFDVEDGVSLFDPAWFAEGSKSKRFINAPAGVRFAGDEGMPPAFDQYFGNWKKFAPRLGFVYDPRGTGQETIRAGFGMFYDTISLGTDQNSSNPWQFSVNIPNPTSMENPWAGSVYGTNPYPVPNPFPKDYVFPQFGGGFNTWKPRREPPYMLQWNLALQKQFPGDWMGSATYLGNRSLHQDFTEPFNPVVYIPGRCVAGEYGLTAAGNCSTTGNENYRRLLYLQDPVGAFGLGNTNWDGDGGNANYNALVTSVQKRFTQNYTVLANHTWSRCMNESGGQNPYDRREGYSSCNQDIRQAFNLSSVVSSPQFSSPVWRKIAGNWKLSTIFTANTGPYVTVSTGLNVPGTGTQPNYVPGQNPTLDNPTISKWFNTAAFVAPDLACTNGGKVGPAFLGSQCYGTVGQGTIQGPGAWNINMALARNFNVKEQTHIAIRIEAFNVLNHTRFAPPNTTMNSADFGKILYANTPRQLQGSLKFTF